MRIGVCDDDIEVLLLDIDMPGRNGIEIGDELSRETDNLNLAYEQILFCFDNNVAP